MKLERAKEELTAESEVAIRTGRRDLHAALQLGIAALELVDGSRCTLNGVPISRLPGETEE